MLQDVDEYRLVQWITVISWSLK